MSRLTAKDFDPAVMKLFDQYVHGQLSRRDFISSAGKYAVGGATGASLLAVLAPSFAAPVVAPADARIKISSQEFPSPTGNGTVRAYVAEPAKAAGKLPVVLVVHENRGLNPHIEDIARRLALDGFIAVAPDALFSLGGYPGNVGAPVPVTPVVPVAAPAAGGYRGRTSPGIAHGIDPMVPDVPGTVLSPAEEIAYQKWRATMPARLQETRDYDLKGFWKKNPNFSLDAPGQHMTDEFKLPTHDTFSNESKYYNPETARYGGRWIDRGNDTWDFVPNDPSHKRAIREVGGERVSVPDEPAGAPGLTKPGNADAGATPTSGDPAADNIRKQGGVDRQKAEADIAKADRDAQIAQQRDEDQRLIDADFQERRAAAQQRLDAATSKFEQESHLVDPRLRPGEMTKARLSVIFGGLGAAQRSAGGGSSTNEALQQIQKKWDDDTARQKANIDTMHDKVLLARTGLKDVDEARSALTAAADARALAQYNAAIKFGEAKLKRLGIPQAEIDTDQRLLTLKAARAQAALKAQEEQDKHNLVQARIALLRHKAAGGSGGGPSRKEDEAIQKQVSEYERRTEGKGINVRGKVDTISGIQALRQQLRDAKESGDGGKMRAAAIAVQEKAGNLLSGGKTTNFQGHLIESPKTLQDTIQEQIGKFTGNPTAGKAYMKSLEDLLNTVEGPHLEDVDRARQEDVDRLLGPGGVARTEKAKANAMNLIASRYRAVRNPDGTPRYEEGKAGADPKGDDMLEQAKAAIKPNSGATPKQRANAAAYIKRRLGAR